MESLCKVKRVSGSEFLAVSLTMVTENTISQSSISGYGRDTEMDVSGPYARGAPKLLGITHPEDTL